MPDPLFESRTPRLALPLLFAGQSQKEHYVNESLARIDALVHCVIEAQASTPPSTPDEGSCWLVGPAAGGAWADRDGTIACFQQGQWLFQTPRDGLRLLDRTTGQHMHYLDSWQLAPRPALPSGGTTIDAEARTVIAAIIDSLVVAGILATQ